MSVIFDNAETYQTKSSSVRKINSNFIRWDNTEEGIDAYKLT